MFYSFHNDFQFFIFSLFIEVSEIHGIAKQREAKETCQNQLGLDSKIKCVTSLTPFGCSFYSMWLGFLNFFFLFHLRLSCKDMEQE